VNNVICPHCHQENRKDANFCWNCGRRLRQECPRCLNPLRQVDKFCDNCGAPVSPEVWLMVGGEPGWPQLGVGLAKPEVLAQPPAEPQPGAAELERFIPPQLVAKLRKAQQSGAMLGERRVVTMLFCDVQGSTAAAERLDPEEWSEIINAAFERMIQPVYRYEGTVARLMGDGLLAFFGAPIAHEDDPLRAVMAGLEILRGVEALNQSLRDQRGLDLAVRVGINTGLVVVGAVGSDLRLEYSALGDAINVAARMEQTATPGTVRVAEDTFRLVARYVEAEPLGEIAVKGKREPVAAYRVVRRRPHREQVAILPGQEPLLVNRHRELETLAGVWDGFAKGRGQIVFVVGDAGIGKSRLLREATQQVRDQKGGLQRFFETAAVSYEAGQAYGLATRLMRGALALTASDTPEVVQKKIRLAAAELPADVAGQAREAWEALLGTGELEGEAFQRQLFAAMAAFWRRRAEEAPVVLLFDDLQWADPASLELLTHLLPLVDQVPLLILCGLRIDRKGAAWRFKTAVEADYPHRYTEIGLQALADADSEELVAGLLGSAAAPAELAPRILARAEGNPLFIQEVVRSLVEEGFLARGEARGGWQIQRALDDVAIPDSLQSLLAARIDRLDDKARQVLQLAAVIGRSFGYRTLEALVDSAEGLDVQLGELQRLNLIREQGRTPELEYSFQQALMHEAAYSTILHKQRRELHRRVGEALQDLYPAQEPALAAVLAFHFLEARLPDQAFHHLLVAGDAALRLHAIEEALAHYDRAREIAGEAGVTAEQLIHLAMQRGQALELGSRFAEAMETYEALEEEAARREDDPMRLAAVAAQGKLRSYGNPLFDPVLGRELVQRALALARKLGDRPAEVRILWNLLNIDRFDVNTLNDAVRDGEQALGLARELGLESELAYILNDLGDAYGSVGRFGEAEEVLREARELWRDLGNQAMLADSLANSAIWQTLMGKFANGLRFAGEACVISERLGNLWGLAYSTMMRGYIWLEQTEFGKAYDDLIRAERLADEAGFVVGRVLVKGFRADFYGHLGLWEEARDHAYEGVSLALDHVPQYGPLVLGYHAMSLLALGDARGAAAQLARASESMERELIFNQRSLVPARFALAMAEGRPEVALAVAEEAIEWAQRIGMRSGLADLGLRRGQALAALNRPDEAWEYLAEAAGVARALGQQNALWQVLAAMSEVARQRGDEATAAQLHQEAQETVGEVAGRIGQEELRRAFLGQRVVEKLIEHR
jgi:class 3 adenylate cyclase/tetratricopeptide (TPR) repeat protein